MTPAFLALEHLSWCRRQGMTWADICSSVNSIGFDEADAFDAVLTAVCMAEDVTERDVMPEPPRRLHLRPVEPQTARFEDWHLSEQNRADGALLRRVKGELRVVEGGR